MQKKELREYKKKAKAQEAQIQLPQVEPVPLTIEEDLSQGQGDRPEAVKAWGGLPPSLLLGRTFRAKKGMCHVSVCISVSPCVKHHAR
jgi:hypothetical protein